MGSWSLSITNGIRWRRRRAASDQAICGLRSDCRVLSRNRAYQLSTGGRQSCALRILEKEAQTQNEAVIAAQKSLDLSIQRYKGESPATWKSPLRRVRFSDEATAVNILGRRMVAAVQLIQALGGGWDSSTFLNS